MMTQHTTPPDTHTHTHSNNKHNSNNSLLRRDLPRPQDAGALLPPSLLEDTSIKGETCGALLPSFLPSFPSFIHSVSSSIHIARAASWGVGRSDEGGAILLNVFGVGL